MKNQIAEKKEREKNLRLTYQSELEPAKDIITDNIWVVVTSEGGHIIIYRISTVFFWSLKNAVTFQRAPCLIAKRFVTQLSAWYCNRHLSPFVFMFRLISCASSLSLTINCDTAIYVLPKSKYMEKAGERRYKFFHFSLRMNYAFTGLVINWSICWVGFDFCPPPPFFWWVPFMHWFGLLSNANKIWHLHMLDCFRGVWRCLQLHLITAVL